MFGVAKNPEKAKQRQADLLAGNKPNPLRTYGIHSRESCDDYKRNALNFSVWERSNHGEKEFKNLDNIPKEHITEWLQASILKGNSMATTRLKAASMAKVMGCNSNTFGINLSKRGDRDNITRSRGTVEKDKHFSIENNKEKINFCEATGLRRSELEQLRPEQICVDKVGNVTLDFSSKKEYRNMTKGGRGRTVHPIREKCDVVKNAKENAEKMGREHVFSKISSAMDVHSYRSTFAENKYSEAIKDLKDSGETIRNDYICRDGSGRRYCRIALTIVSKELGHSRLDIVVKHYLDIK
ncbi:hypothetical protein [uncultured Clostridium sp.]|uniref:hypothetical protein n=1 Tax=uncultured Clostridium sp. TaxID=59620 RepID=UPI0026352352|nr:hypothetical protein [uncultured Clostridium sp.]